MVKSHFLCRYNQARPDKWLFHSKRWQVFYHKIMATKRQGVEVQHHTVTTYSQIPLSCIVRPLSEAWCLVQRHTRLHNIGASCSRPGTGSPEAVLTRCCVGEAREQYIILCLCGVIPVQECGQKGDLALQGLARESVNHAAKHPGLLWSI